MHMADALLSPSVGLTFWTASLGTLAYASRKIKDRLDDGMVPLMGVLGAFIFAAQMINFTIPVTGSSGHLGGGLLLSILLGPHAAFLVMASVLTVQSLFFADGGVLALGCNIWNLGFYPAYLVYPLVYRPLTVIKPIPSRVTVAAVLSSILGLQLGAFSVVLQTFLSGRSELPFGAFLLLMQPIHLAIGVVEGVVTAGVVKFVRHARPEILQTEPGGQSLASGWPLKRILAAFAVLTLIVAGVFSWFASTHPDGLEWSVEKVYGKPELPESERGIAAALKGVQDVTAFLPDYTFRNPEAGRVSGSGVPQAEEQAPAWPSVDSRTSLAGVVGAGIVLAFVTIVGVGLRFLRRGKTR